jgi:tripartite-type tricarboxylate transporter receptor subunit TctC
VKFFFILVSLFFSAPAFAKETITVYSKFNLSDVGTKQITGFIDEFNRSNGKYVLVLRSVPGAFGEASVRRAIVDARSGVKSILFNTVDIVTILKELEGKDSSFVYDKSVDLIPIQGISSTFHGLFGLPEIENVDVLVSQLKTRKEFFYGYTSIAVVPKIASEIFMKHYGLNNGKLVVYKNQADLQFAVLNKEILFAFGSITEAIHESNLKLLLSTSKSKSQFYPNVPTGIEKGILNFKYNAQTFLSIPKEFSDLGRELAPIFDSICESESYAKLLTSLKRNQSCLSESELKQFINEEYGWYLDNK